MQEYLFDLSKPKLWEAAKFFGTFPDIVERIVREKKQKVAFGGKSFCIEY